MVHIINILSFVEPALCGRTPTGQMCDNLNIKFGNDYYQIKDYSALKLNS